jgi:ankyrin repeat protein
MNRLAQRLKAAVWLAAMLFTGAACAGSYDEFFQAVTRNDGAAVQAWLQRGFDANSRDPKGQTALFLALRGGAFGVADALLADRSLDVNALNEAGESALMIAALKGEADWIARLLDRGAKVNKTGWAPLHYAATGAEPAVVKLLLDRGAVVDAASPNRSTPLMMAAQYGREGSVDVLLAHGADPKLKNDRGLNAADFARLGKRAALAARLDKLSH